MNLDFSYLDDIRDAVMSPQAANSEVMKAVAGEYSDACREANRRLREVVRLLHGGFRTEAIGVAEQDPPLLVRRTHEGERDVQDPVLRQQLW